MLISDLISKIRLQVGDNDPIEPNIKDLEMENILEDSAREYSRIKGYVKFYEIPYESDKNVYTLPEDSYKVKKVTLEGNKLNYIDNLDQVVIDEVIYVETGTLKITYNKYFKPEEVDERELDIYLLYAEALCYKLMASKTADLIKFSTGEKTIDESTIYKKYLELHKNTSKLFRNKLVKSYGRRANNMLENLDYDLPYPPIGEKP